jgi:hypothetical protein
MLVWMHPMFFFSLLLLSLCGDLLEISMCTKLTIVMPMCLYYWAFGNDETCGKKHRLLCVTLKNLKDESCIFDLGYSNWNLTKN